MISGIAKINSTFATLLIFTFGLFLTACSTTAKSQPNLDLSAQTSIEEHQIIDSYADKLISSYNITFKKNQNSQENMMTLWEHAIFEMDFTPPKHTINSKSATYVKKHKKNFEKQLANGHLFLYHIINELRIRDMPLELAVIPIIESNFNPHAVSPAGAKGIWQFTPGTAKRFKLYSDGAYDMRSDPIASTEAALNYFSYLYSFFDDWDLAIAAYNVGEGTVLKAIKRNKAKGLSTDLWHLNIPKSGIDYVEKLYAYTDMLRNSHKNEIHFPNMPFKPVFKKIALNGQNINQVSQKTGISSARLLKLNPGFKNERVHTKQISFVLIPVNNNDLPEYYTLDKSNESIAQTN